MEEILLHCFGAWPPSSAALIVHMEAESRAELLESRIVLILDRIVNLAKERTSRINRVVLILDRSVNLAKERTSRINRVVLILDRIVNPKKDSVFCLVVLPALAIPMGLAEIMSMKKTTLSNASRPHIIFVVRVIWRI